MPDEEDNEHKEEEKAEDKDGDDGDDRDENDDSDEDGDHRDENDDGDEDDSHSSYGWRSRVSSHFDNDRDFDFELDEDLTKTGSDIARCCFSPGGENLRGRPEPEFHESLRRKQTAQKGLQDFLKTGHNRVRCCYSPMLLPGRPEESEEEREEPESKRRKVEEASEKGLAELQSLAKTTERLQLLGRYAGTDMRASLVGLHRSISEALGESLLHCLTVLRVDGISGSGDPIFGTRYEFRRKYKAIEHDLFELLTAAFLSGGKCGLKKLTLSGGSMSAESFMKFLRVARPPLESFRCRYCLFHGRNFEPLVKALKASTTAPTGLLEFEMDAYVGGKDPFGLLADCFPNLQMLRAKRIFGEVPPDASLERWKSLRKGKSRFPWDSLQLKGNCAVCEDVVELFMTSEHHSDSYNGQGLNWDDCRITSECHVSWHVGKPITKEQVLAFMTECGIRYSKDHVPEMSQCIMPSSDDDEEIIILQVAVEKLPDDRVAIRGTTLGGREVATMKAVDPAATLVRTVIEELAQKYPCDFLALRLALPSGSAVDVMSKGSESLASVLK